MNKKIITGLVISSVIVQAILFSLLYQFIQLLGTLQNKNIVNKILLKTITILFKVNNKRKIGGKICVDLRDM